jgi:hypothetical protein
MICFSKEAAPTADDSHRFAVSVTCKVVVLEFRRRG